MGTNLELGSLGRIRGAIPTGHTSVLCYRSGDIVMLRYAPLIGLVLPTLAWWFVAWDVSAPFSGWVERFFWLYFTLFCGYVGFVIRKGVFGYD